LLSGGQRQRIAIARAILADPSILILDEAASALDAESEQLVEASIDALRGGRTILVAAHRLSTIRKADHIYVLEGGRIVESGTREDLLGLNGRFRQLHNIQFKT
jgi:ATP-binding cassette, subfamily B, bacterial MsbA